MTRTTTRLVPQSAKLLTPLAIALRNAGFSVAIHPEGVSVNLNRRVASHEIVTVLEAAGFTEQRMTIARTIDGRTLVRHT